MGIYYTITNKYNVTGDCYKSNGASNITQPNASGANGSFTTNWLCNCKASWVKKWSEAYVEITFSPPADMDTLRSVSIVYRYKYVNDVSGNWQSPEIKTGYINTSGGYEYKNTRNGDLSSGSFSSWFTDTISTPPKHSDGKYHLAMHCQNRQDLSALEYVKVEISEITLFYSTKQIPYKFVSDGTVISSGTVAYNTTPPTPSEPTKTGYLFSGWDKTVGNITSDTTYNAVWTPYNYYVGFLPNGAITGGSLMPTMTCKYDSEYIIPDCTYIYEPIDVIFEDSVEADVVLYAVFSHWRDTDTGATYKAGAKIKNIRNTRETVVSLEAVWTFPTLTLPSTSIEGATFLYWQTESGVTYNAGTQLTLTQDLKLRAIWRLNKIEKVYGGNIKTTVYVGNTECKAVYVGNELVFGLP